MLVVDDDPNLTDLLVDTLATIGYEAFAAQSAKTALEVLRKEPIDLVVSDINMPDMSGLELLEEIKKANRHLPVMLITGIGNDSIRSRAYSSGQARERPSARLSREKPCPVGSPCALMAGLGPGCSRVPASRW